MAIDPSDPETFDEADENGEDANGSTGIEAPEADAAEQQADVLRQRDTPLTERGTEEADPADAAEQSRVVEENDDDYR